MEVPNIWLALFSFLSTLNISNTSVNTCREPFVKITDQSSTLSLAWSYRAVDGCSNQRYSSGCCMHTLTTGYYEAWWRVDLQDQINIEKIKIYYRDEGVSQQKMRFGGYQIYMSNTSNLFGDGTPCYQDTTSSESSVDLAPTITTCIGDTRYLGIYLDRRTLAYSWYSTTAIMELCEVIVYGCPVGKFGSNNCDYSCDTTCVNSRCDPTTGECTDCAAGSYKSGLICSPCPTNCISNTCDVETGGCTACIDGYHGNVCDQQCPLNCIDDFCTQVNGECAECTDGYYGPYCYACSAGCSTPVCDKTHGYCSPCSDGFFGISCNETCSFNCKNSICAQDAGECEECVSGYHGSTCDQLCPLYCTNRICTQHDGYCTECVPGYYGSTCGLLCPTYCTNSMCTQQDGFCTECVSGYYGSTCSQLCPINCKDSTCTQQDGLCTECVSGYHGSTCDQLCPTNCKNSTCTQQDELCTERDNFDLYGGDVLYGGEGDDTIHACTSYCKCDMSSGQCLECDVGTYGALCEHDCPVQCKGGTCTQLDGYCYECEAGIFGIYCHIPCPAFCSSDGCGQETGLCAACTPGYYGHDCGETCGQCRDLSCTMVDGTCDCSDGWEGETCNTKTAVVDSPGGDNTWTYAGGGMGAVVAITLVIAVIALVLRRRRVSSYTKNPPEIVDNAFENVEMTPVVVPNPPIYRQPRTRPTSKLPDATNENELANVNMNDTGTKADDVVAYHNDDVTGVSIHELRYIIDSKMASNGAVFQEEFKTLPVGAVYPHEAGKKPTNKAKNRFKNTLPYDHSRIILENIDGDIDTGYINANYIDGVDNTSAYIASQGPKPNTLDDFWRMVWQVNSGKIVMLTNLAEGRKTKCHKYWPDEGGALATQSFDVELDRERIYAFYVMRDISIFNKRTKQERQVQQFHFTTWPDHGTPDTLELVLFHRRVTSYRTQFTGQIVVHCSAGIGRTGTFIGLDALLSHWKRTGQFDIPSYLRVMRRNRVNMVQTYKQYIALHELLLEGFNLQDSCIPRTHFPAALATMCPKEDKPANQTKIFHEFEALQKSNPNYTPSCFTAALKKENKDKNRDLDILAADMFRPFLQSQLSNRTDYINAVMIQSYTSKSGYLMTQFPLEHTVDDFWAMVCDYSCQNIVVFGQLTKEVWLQDDTSKAKRRAFSVKKLTELHTHCDVTVDDYQVVSRRSSNTKTVRIYSMPQWSSDSLLPHSDLSILQLLEKLDSRRRSDDTIPVIVMCRDGCTQSGLFCCISNIRDQMKMDEEVDIFQNARQIKMRRPEALRNVKQYQYCYNILGQYLDSTDVYVN